MLPSRAFPALTPAPSLRYNRPGSRNRVLLVSTMPLLPFNSSAGFRPRRDEPATPPDFGSTSGGSGGDRLIPFPSRRPGAEPSRGPVMAQRQAPERTTARRRPRRRRSSTPWLQRNALSLAAISVLIALLGVAFGLLQLLNHPESTAPTAASPTSVAEQLATPATAGVAGVADTNPAPSPTAPAPHEIQSSVTALQPNYTIQQGDTLGRIATQFNTTVARIQAFNNLSDPRALRVGTKLVIPPPLPQ